MAAFNRLQLGLRETGTTASIPSDPRARLMYYIDCICTVIQMDSGDLRRLRDYRNYWLSSDETDLLLATAVMLDPRPLLNVVLFADEAMCRGSANKFYELSAVNTTVAVSNGLVIGGVRRRVNKIMCFTINWLERNYTEPLREVLLKRRAEQARAQQTAQSCVIL